jgi:hypothetical protein
VSRTYGICIPVFNGAKRLDYLFDSLEGMVKDKNVSNEKAGVAARMIRKLNKERNTIKNILNEWSGGGFEDIKVKDLGLLEQKNGKRHET